MPPVTSQCRATLKAPRLGWSFTQMAWSDAGYLATYAIGQFAFGMCGDKLGTRIVILTGMLASVVTSVLMGRRRMWILRRLVLFWSPVYVSENFAAVATVEHIAANGRRIDSEKH